MAIAARAARIDLEALLRARKLDNTLTSALPSPGLLDEQMAVPTGIAVLDERLHGGVPRGQVSEIVGPRSSGRVSLLAAMLAGATARGEIAALVDTLDMFDAASAAAGGIDLARLLWIRGQPPSPLGHPVGFGEPRWPGAEGQGPGAQWPASREARERSGGWPGDSRLAASRPMSERESTARRASGDRERSPASRGVQRCTGDEPGGDAGRLSPGQAPRLRGNGEAWERAVDRAVKALNLVLQAGGFGLVALDLAEVPPAVVRQLPFTTWLRLQRVIEGSETACVLLGAEPVARSAGGVTISLRRSGQGPGARLFLGLDVEARLSRARWPDTTPCRIRFEARP